MEQISLRSRWMTGLFVMFLIPLAIVWRAEAAEERYPVGHPDQGLPHPDFVVTPYHADQNHVLNRVFRASFLVTTIPAEVGLALPRMKSFCKERA
jgi:hypothetical protein